MTLSLLPATLLALLFASPALAEPVSINDPLRSIALHAPKPPEPPVCCLKPLPSDPVDDHLFLSFEEWKARQSAIHPIDTNHSDIHNASTIASEPAEPPPPQTESDIPPAIPPTTEQTPRRYRIPLTDRFNYASLDCSARVHFTHKSAKSPASILSSKKDRYMLSPCTGRAKAKDEKQFVVVELCDDIRVDTVQLANYEFFSGVFKDFTVSLAKTSTDADAWTVAGTFRAKNIRGVQSFHLPPLRDFYRYIRIDFHSHYGNEYYCPVSLLRVYGLTHLEEWKWEVWEEESRAKLSAIEQTEHEAKSEETEAPATVQETGTSIPSPSPSPKVPFNTTGDIKPTSNDTNEIHEQDHIEEHNDEGANGAHSTDTYHSSPVDSTAGPEPEAVEKKEKEEPTTTIPTPIPAITVDTSTGTIPVVTTPSIPTIQPIPSASPPLLSQSIIPLPPTGESIYRTIMNRLTALQTNHTLFAVYLEQQNHAIREIIARLGEDLGRLEGIGRAREAAWGRSVAEFERERDVMGGEVGQLRERVEYLTEEIILEKRLGIAQLVLLLAVLVFMGLTRGSRAEHPPVLVPEGGMREWGKRHFRLSGEWGRRFRRSTSRDAVATAPIQGWDRERERERERERQRPPALSAKSFPVYNQDKLEFPRALDPLSININTPGTPRRRTGSSASRTPKKTHLRAITPTRPTFGIQRSNSHGAAAVHLGSVPRSARRWARSAHLHEVAVTRRGGDENEGVPVSAGREKKGRLDGFPPLERGKKEEGEGEGWIDTDSVDGSEVDFEFGAM